MGVQYLHFNIFGMALSDMATSTGSISQRLCGAYLGYFYKVSWSRELQSVPEEFKADFLLLKKLLRDDAVEIMEKQRNEYLISYRKMDIELSEEQLERMSNMATVIKSLHWKKAQRIAKLISSLHFNLGQAVKDIEREKYSK